ncbi:hypothetical protein QMO33_24735, partial [Escherichia coli]|nr:hypothetical protein [Escherichia coli]
LAVSEQKIEEHGLIHNVIPIRSDLFRDLPQGQDDLIVTHPPYGDAGGMADLPNENRHQPGLGPGPALIHHRRCRRAHTAS